MKSHLIFYCLLILFFGISCEGEKDETLSSDEKVTVTREIKYDYLTWKIEAANGTWHFEIEHTETGELSTGFNSAIDSEGNNWIGNNCVDNREWRGWPNFAADGFGHPCRGGGGLSQWVDIDGTPIDFEDNLEGEHLILESWNDLFRVRYHFFTTHAAIEVLHADDLYAFLWEGPIAGEMNVEQQRYVLEDGDSRIIPHGDMCPDGRCLGHIDQEFGRNFPSPFFYFTDPDAEQVLYVGAKDQSDGGDEGWAQPQNMVIFSFGREDDIHALSGTDAVSVFGFLDKESGHEQISTTISSHLESPF